MEHSEVTSPVEISSSFFCFTGSHFNQSSFLLLTPKKKFSKNVSEVPISQVLVSIQN